MEGLRPYLVGVLRVLLRMYPTSFLTIHPSDADMFPFKDFMLSIVVRVFFLWSAIAET